MDFDEYFDSLPIKRSLSAVKIQILEQLWGDDEIPFPKPWVSSKELLELTGQKYFDRRTRELREKLGCDLESQYVKDLGDYAWRLVSSDLAPPQDREYLTNSAKKALFERSGYSCAACGCKLEPGLRGLQADHKVPLSRGGSNDDSNWQALCVNCNVGKRRACEGCNLACVECVWAFPEKLGIRTVINLSSEDLLALGDRAREAGTSSEQVMIDAIKTFLSKC